MTGDTNISDRVILIDEWPDGTIESTAWVEVIEGATTPEIAVKLIEDAYPLSDRDEADEEMYVCEGETVRLCPDPQVDEDDADEGRPWIDADPENPLHKGALDFLVIRVVCKL